MMLLVIMLTNTQMHTSYFLAQPTMEVSIHNRCSHFKLTDRGFFVIGSDWNGYPAQEVDSGNMMNFKLIPFMPAFEGVLTYELKRVNVRPDDQSKSTHIRLFVAWKSERYKEFCVFIHLIEYSKQVDWNRIKSKEYYRRYANQLSIYTSPIKNKWLINDGTVLMTRLNLDFMQKDGRLNIFITEGNKTSRAMKPVWVDLET
jgi:hypothetical protein